MLCVESSLQKHCIKKTHNFTRSNNQAALTFRVARGIRCEMDDALGPFSFLFESLQSVSILVGSAEKESPPSRNGSSFVGTHDVNIIASCQRGVRSSHQLLDAVQWRVPIWVSNEEELSLPQGAELEGHLLPVPRGVRPDELEVLRGDWDSGDALSDGR